MNASKSIIIAALSLAITLTLFWTTGLIDNRSAWASASVVAPLLPTAEKTDAPGRSKGISLRLANPRSAPAQTSFTPLSATDILNGDFENGPDGSWTEYSYKDWPIIVHQEDTYIIPHSGNWVAWLGGDDDEIASISQTVALPAEVSMLSFWHWIDSDEEGCGYDFAWVKINDADLLEFDLCEQYNTEGWVHTTVNIAAYAGTTATLQFRVETDESQFSNYFVDDVVLLNRPPSDHLTYLPLLLKNFWSGYFDDFSNPNSGWCVEETADVKMGYLSGEFQLLLKRPNLGYMCVPDNLIVPTSSYSVEVDARMASGNSGSYSLVFGLRWGQGTRQNYVVSVEPYTQYYRIQRRNLDGSWTTLVDWTYSELINPDAQTNHLRIDRWGTNIWFSINGLFETMISDNTITGTGLQAGVEVNSYTDTPVDVRFDNFKASQP